MSPLTPRLGPTFSRLLRLAFGGLSDRLPSPVSSVRAGFHGRFHGHHSGHRVLRRVSKLHSPPSLNSPRFQFCAARCLIPQFAFRRDTTPRGRMGGICLRPVRVSRETRAFPRGHNHQLINDLFPVTRVYPEVKPPFAVSEGQHCLFLSLIHISEPTRPY